MELAKGSGVQYPFWLRFNAWYFGLTILYWILAGAGGAYFMGIPTDSDTGGVAGHAGTVAGNFIGLFVPIGPSNIFFLLFPGGLASLGLVICSLVFVERKLRRIPHDKAWGKIFLNLLILFFLTALVDFLTFGHWASLNILLGHGSYL